MNIKHSPYYYLQLKYALLVVIGVLTYFTLYQIAHAAYQKTFTISAYYSPIEGQERYVTGSYAGDIRLNGSGVNSADGTPVYPGMIAAPKSYAFGTKMNIPGIGLVAVHDRGGAIVHAGERGQHYDRLDVWMGYGDKGLNRALNWGKRNVDVTVYGVDPSIQENVYLEGFTEAEKFVRTIVQEQKIFKTDLWHSKSGEDVGKLQRYLKNLGYYKGTVDNYYGDEVYKAVMAFQIDHDIVDNEEEFGAGYFGPQTRTKIEAIIDKRREDTLPKRNLGRDDTGEDVKKLQKALIKLGYDLEITGVYDQKTINAVFDFQHDNDILRSEDDLGAGYFGPQTLAILSDRLASLDAPLSETLDILDDEPASFIAFEKDLSLGDQGQEVTRLQKELKKFNLLRIDPTGYYGEVTQNAVFKFQQRKGILTLKTDHGAGIFGPQTRNHLNTLLGYRANNNQKIATRTAAFNNKNTTVSRVATIPESKKETEKTQPKTIKTSSSTFNEQLTYGSQGKQVVLLQKALADLGFFQGGLFTDYFGEETTKAVIAFQLDHGIIRDKNEDGAGQVGPQTRAALNSTI